jgi:membrane fusion protein, multidrug efflux system
VRGQLAGGEKVVVDGAQRVTDGSRATERAPGGGGTPQQRVSSTDQ